MLNIPKQYQNLYKKAMSGKSRIAGIKAKCLDCCCWQMGEAKDCGIPTCPLYPYNPYQLMALKKANKLKK
ncbi:MAG: hypothetical protein ACYC54_07610 [Sedimentisphaerales bacterium]